tara:strand:+ start:815 stop:1216 length:402 start_codon:yes stop_codon:yes gene_type:complete
MAYNTQPTTTGKKDPMKTKAEGAKPSPQKKEWTKKSPKAQHKIDWKNTAKPPEPSRDHVDRLVPKKRTPQDKKSTRKTSNYRIPSRTVTQKTGPGVRTRKSNFVAKQLLDPGKPVKKPTGGKKRIQQKETLKR